MLRRFLRRWANMLETAVDQSLEEIGKPLKKVGASLVVGGGIAGMQAALDLAESGIKVYLVDKSPAIGGAMAQLDKTFPTNDCAMCTLAPRMVDCGRHPNIEKLTYSEVIDIKGEPGNFHALIKKKARAVDPDKCTGCEDCVQNCLVRYRPYLNLAPVPEPQIEAEDKKVVDDIIDYNKHRTAPLVNVLQDINEQFNYLPEPAIRYISYKLSIPLTHILKIATFYSLFSLKPRGKYVISICTGTTCFVLGADRIMDTLQTKLGIRPGEVSEDGKFSLEPVRCIGCCALAPVVRIDTDIHARVQSAKAFELLSSY
jgi:NADH:ubiquinone oxidoreductase subunit E/NAD-dependent dihydropyrimidine dehydrogenase PreA subunit